jgi:3',5'-cyclic AMP phosphodiesterase CpdA
VTGTRRRQFVAAAVGLLATGVLALVGFTPTSVGSEPGTGVIAVAAEIREPPHSGPSVAQPTVRLAAVGDIGTGDEAAYATARAITTAAATDTFDALILLGDNVYPVGDPSLLDEAIFEPFRDVLSSGTRLLPVLGNHDVMAGHGDAQAAALGMPGRWYSAELGPVLFIGLDSTKTDDPGQRLWLEDTLAASASPWIIAALHHPPFSAGWHGSDQAAREVFTPLFEKFGVQLVLAGHDHDYQRSHPIQGVTYVVSGGGAKLRPAGTAEFTAVSVSTRHFLDIAVWSDRLRVQAVRQDGQVFDEVTLSP